MEVITEAVIVCKKVTIEHGIEIFKVGYLNALEPDRNENGNIVYYQLKQRYSNNEKYYAMSLKNYENEDMREHIFNLISKDIKSILYTYV